MNERAKTLFSSSNNQILIATGNKGKLQEISKILEPTKLQCLSTKSFNIEEPEETGKTFAENSAIKAKYYAKKTNLISLADDSGICITDLNNKPGINSARFAFNPSTNNSDFIYAFDKIFWELKKNKITPSCKPKAFFICNLTIFDPKTNYQISFEGRVDGYITYPARGINGFGYDPIFIKEDMTQTFGEIDTRLKDKISHRALAAEKMLNWILGHC